MDRNRARSNIKIGLWAGGLALLVFAIAFYIAVLYLA
jgi:hypothetical protein